MANLGLAKCSLLLHDDVDQLHVGLGLGNCFTARTISVLNSEKEIIIFPSSQV